MSQAPPTRTAPTTGHPPTRRLQVRARWTWPGSWGERQSLHFVVELYDEQQGRWARLSCRTGPIALDEALLCEDVVRALKDLEYLATLAPGESPPDSEEPRP